MNATDLISTILARDHTIAVVGLSNNPQRPSYGVAAYLQQHGYRIVPINPTYSSDPAGILGERCYATLTDAARELAKEGVSIDMVDVFRRSEEVGPVADEAIAIGARTLWLQLSVINEAAQQRAQAAGLDVVADRCVKIEHAQRGALRR